MIESKINLIEYRSAVNLCVIESVSVYNTTLFYQPNWNDMASNNLECSVSSSGSTLPVISSEQCVLVKLIHDESKIPYKATPGSAGFDLTTVERTVIHPGNVIKLKIGIKLEIPPGYYGQIVGRSGLATRSNIIIVNGVIDSDYRGEICVMAYTIGSSIVLPMGTRCAQLIFNKIHEANDLIITHSELTPTERALGGFGHSGV